LLAFCSGFLFIYNLTLRLRGGYGVQGVDVSKGGKRGADGTNAVCAVAASVAANDDDDGEDTAAAAEPASPGACSMGDASHVSQSGGGVATGGAPGGEGGRGLRPTKGEACAALVSAASLRRLAQVRGYGGRFGGGDAAASYTLSRPGQPAVAHTPPSYLAGGGGGGGLSGGGGSALGGEGGGSFADQGRRENPLVSLCRALSSKALAFFLFAF